LLVWNQRLIYSQFREKEMNVCSIWPGWYNRGRIHDAHGPLVLDYSKLSTKIDPWNPCVVQEHELRWSPIWCLMEIFCIVLKAW